MLAGKYLLTVSKGWRVTMPEFCRAAFPLRQLVVTFKEQPTHWLIYPAVDWEKEKAALIKTETHEALRRIARAEIIQFDWRGRFTLPQTLRGFGLRSFGTPPFPVVIFGMSTYGELWRREAWDAQEAAFGGLVPDDPLWQIPPEVQAAMDAMDQKQIDIAAGKIIDRWGLQETPPHG